MVDASVGGKTAVDTPHGKNLVGAFHPPVAVAADPRVLRTLPERDYRGGLAEAVKHGLIADAGYFEWMERETEALLRREEGALTHLIRRSVEIKAEVVGEDERETGRRAILNAGHTVAHALEQATAYAIPHGEAVAIGLVAESRPRRAPGRGPGRAQRARGLAAPTPGPSGASRECAGAGADSGGHGARQEESHDAHSLRVAECNGLHVKIRRVDDGGRSRRDHGCARRQSHKSIKHYRITHLINTYQHWILCTPVTKSGTA